MRSIPNVSRRRLAAKMRSLSAACSTALKNFIRKAVFSRTQPFIRAVPIGYHVHDGESETYYILSGRGIFNDNGTVVEVGPGDVTFTGDGEGPQHRGHGGRAD